VRNCRRCQITSVREGVREGTVNCRAAAADETRNGRAVQVIRMMMIIIDSTSRWNGLADVLNGVRFQ